MQNDFNKIGITPEEYSVYKSILESPTTNVSVLAKRVSITRVTVYKILESLVNKNLIKKVSNTKTKVKYIAESPDVLLGFVEKYKKESNKQLEELEKQIPLLKVLAGDSKNLEESNIVVLRGPNTLIEIDKMILIENKQLYGFTYDYHVEACFEYDKNYRLKDNEYLQVVMSVGDKFVFPGNKKSINTAKMILKMNPFLKGRWQPRWVDSKKLNLNINFYCFSDNIAFSLGSYKERDFLAYIIKNKEIAESMKKLSIFLWESANPIN